MLAVGAVLDGRAAVTTHPTAPQLAVQRLQRSCGETIDGDVADCGMDRSLDVPGVGAPRRVFQLSGPQSLRQRLTEWHGGVGREVAVCLSLKAREGLLGLPARGTIGAFDGLAQVAVAPSDRVLSGVHTDL